MSTAVIQQDFRLTGARVRRPLVDRIGARAVLDMEDWQLDGATESGDIVGILNIAGADAAQRELRWPGVCLEEFKAGVFQQRDDEELARLIFGHPQALVRARWVYSRLNCHPTHFYNLVIGRVIALAAGSVQRPGPGGSAVVTWTELVRFINARRIS